MAKKVLSSEEYGSYTKSNDRLDYFISQWTKKEAYLKCYNDGINSFSCFKNNYNAVGAYLFDLGNVDRCFCASQLFC